MFGIPLIEWVGYLASLMVAISLIMTDIVKLRIINSIGCLIFVIYGAIIKAYPVAVMNAFIVVINIYYLIRMKKGSR